MCDFTNEPVTSWSALLGVSRCFDDDWVFRGQPTDEPLRTLLDRALAAYGIPQAEAPAIEEQMIRDFRRRFEGPGSDLIAGDSLYCLAHMQHHGAPTRLLDVTYSFFVACLFAIDSLQPPNERAVIWCVRKGWTLDASRAKICTIEERNIDEKRNEESFRRLYMNSQQTFVFHENPFRLNQRLIIQQGGFLCPGDIRGDFEANLKGLVGWHSRGNVLKVVLDMSASLRQEAMQELLRMNITRASLFPGMGGFAASVSQRLPLLRRLASVGTGRSAT